MYSSFYSFIFILNTVGTIPLLLREILLLFAHSDLRICHKLKRFIRRLKCTRQRAFVNGRHPIDWHMPPLEYRFRDYRTAFDIFYNVHGSRPFSRGKFPHRTYACHSVFVGVLPVSCFADVGKNTCKRPAKHFKIFYINELSLALET